MDPTESESEKEGRDDALCFFVFVIILLLYAVGFLAPFFCSVMDTTTTQVQDRSDAVFGIISYYLRSLCQMVGVCLAMVAPREINLERF